MGPAVLALEAGSSGVTSNTVCPAYVRTELVERQIEDQARVHGLDREAVVSDVMLAASVIKRLIEPAEMGDAVLFLCSDAAAFVNGSRIVLDGGWSAQ